jgi:outer membrane receptor protein involved in Fe transport
LNAITLADSPAACQWSIGIRQAAVLVLNANLSKTVGHLTFNLGLNNLFNNDASQWGIDRLRSCE